MAGYAITPDADTPPMVTPMGVFVRSKDGTWYAILGTEGPPTDLKVLLSGPVEFRVAAPQVAD